MKADTFGYEQVKNQGRKENDMGQRVFLLVDGVAEMSSGTN